MLANQAQARPKTPPTETIRTIAESEIKLLRSLANTKIEGKSKIWL